MKKQSETIIQIKNLGLRYGNFDALIDINEEVHRKDCIVICGPSGSGKSSLLRCINGLEKFQQGDVIVDGISVKNCKDFSLLRLKVGMVFQQFALYPHMTVLKNITLAPVKVLGISKAQAEKKAKEVLDRFDVIDQAAKYPAELSGGQQQRVAICRALVLGPEVLMFDEPTSALDPEMIGEVLEVMLGLVKDGMTMIIVTHEMSFARRVANEIIFMEAGRIIERGTDESFFENPSNPRTKAFLDKILL
ncbi:MAG: amino acid ABC transporter ATP-binding protein [Deltaproteobacteria bacterium]|nr:amino acid ABC transporter ATP-binding protein [Deltaproteobacteria bacterium]MBW1994319.1 amino acid ABC transporter ATP-binding protein [Deltaproteobacteria bacterium]MBW2152586.1 amino acid ABC transporter ATP-binding protein [Deltaproteobacteria bacterium]